MGAFIAKQPNGLYCRFSSVTDCPTHWNMTEEDYIELCKQKAEEEARDVLKYHLWPFDKVKEDFSPNNMTRKAFKAFLKAARKEVTPTTCASEDIDLTPAETQKVLAIVQGIIRDSEPFEGDKILCHVGALQYLFAIARARVKEEACCPHGYADWDDCPDCCH